jgi:hypothetical protein
VSRQQAAGSGQQAAYWALLYGYGLLAFQSDSLGYFQGKPRRLQRLVNLDISEGDLIDISQRVFSLDTDHVVRLGIYPKGNLGNRRFRFTRQESQPVTRRRTRFAGELDDVEHLS